MAKCTAPVEATAQRAPRPTALRVVAAMAAIAAAAIAAGRTRPRPTIPVGEQRRHRPRKASWSKPVRPCCTRSLEVRASRRSAHVETERPSRTSVMSSPSRVGRPAEGCRNCMICSVMRCLGLVQRKAMLPLVRRYFAKSTRDYEVASRDRA